MQTKGITTRVGSMAYMGVLDINCFACPICKAILPRKANSMMRHISAKHIKDSTFPKDCMGYLAGRLRSQRGINARISSLGEEKSKFIHDFANRVMYPNNIPLGGDSGERGE